MSTIVKNDIPIGLKIYQRSEGQEVDKNALDDEWIGVHVGRSLWKDFEDNHSPLNSASMKVLLEIPSNRL